MTKPHFEVIKEICEKFINHRDNILFRFTIGSKNTSALTFWEPNAPSFDERKRSLKYAFEKGFSTSVSCEPMLDDSTEELVSILVPYVTDSIWIGKANFLLKRLRTNGITDAETIKKANELIELQSDDNIKALYEKLKDTKKVKWKESIKKVVNLEVATIKGLDI